VRTDEPVPLGSRARHDVIAEGLREFAALGGGELRLVYVDGSEPLPFGSGLPLTRRGGSPQLRVGLMSLRHLDRDADVDAYWFRNRLVSTSARSVAETDAYCARQTVNELTALAKSGVTCFELVQTGFEGAVVGFYRGLLKWLMAGNTMTVIPRYLAEDGTDATGTEWSR
jgi:hypothetical protein